MINLDRIADKTRGGYPVKIAGVNPKAESNQIAVWVLIDSKWKLIGLYLNGRFYPQDITDFDLIEIPEYKEGQVWHDENTLYFVRRPVIDTKLRATTNRGQVWDINDIPKTATLVFDPDEKGIEL